MVKAVLFDLDNTIVDFMLMKKKSCEAAVSAMVYSGLNASEKDALKILYELYDKHGMEDQTIFQRLLKKINHNVDYKILARGIEAYRNAQIAYMKPFPHVFSTLIGLREKGIKLAIVSDAPKIKAYLRLVELKIVDFFDIVITYDDTGKYKPNPEPFNLALKKLKIKPTDALFVGDMNERDVKGASALGIKTVLMNYWNLPKKKTNADYVIKDFKDLLEIV